MSREFHMRKLSIKELTFIRRQFGAVLDGKIDGDDGEDERIDVQDKGSREDLVIVRHLLGKLSAAYGTGQGPTFTVDDSNNKKIVPLDAIKVTITECIRSLPGQASADGCMNPVITLRIDQPIPNRNGLITAEVKGRQCKFRLLQIDESDLPEDEKKVHSDRDKREDEYKAGTPTSIVKFKYAFSPNLDPGRVEGTVNLFSAPFSSAEVSKDLTKQFVRIELDS